MTTVEAKIEECGNGWPRPGDCVPGGDLLYRVERIHTGNAGAGNYVYADVAPIEWSACADADQFTARVVEITVTDDQIRALCAEAEAGGNIDQVMICDMALHGPGYVNDTYSVAADAMRVCRTQAGARAECARVIVTAAVDAAPIGDTTHD